MKKLLAAVLVAGLAFIACQKEFSIENGNAASLSGAWEFKDSTNTKFAGNPVQYYIDDTSNTASATMVYTGTTANLSAQISIEVFFPTGTAVTGTYQSANGQVNFLYSFGAGKYYKAEAFTQFSTENITVNITAISDTSVTGTFSGVALDSTNRLIPIKEGKFSYRKRATTPPASTVSVGTLGSAVDTCTGSVVSGTYKKGVALTATNTVTLTVNVATIGTFSIFSDTLKGIHFGGIGSFTATGIQNVTLPGVGTPTDSAAALRFRVRYGTSNCTFLVKIDTGGTVVVVPPTGDYFPTTANSNWSYDFADETGPLSDTSYVRSTGTNFPLLSNSYTLFTANNGITSPDSNYYRKTSGSYYYVYDLSDLTGTATLVESQILKDNVPVNSTWEENFNVNILGSPATAKFKYTILAKAVAATVGNISSTDVIKVKLDISIGNSGIFIPYATLEEWFGRGIGVMYFKYFDAATPAQFQEEKLRRFQVF